MSGQANYLGLKGIEFIEFTSPDPGALHRLFLEFGFSRLMRHQSKKIDYYKQNDIHILLNYEAGSFAEDFNKKHGPSLCSMGLRVENAPKAQEVATERGAKPGTGDFKELPAIYGIGESFIYLIDNFKDPERFKKMGFIDLENPDIVPDKGFILIDHLTNNVEKGTMNKWADFYKNIFGFTEIRYFDIKGKKTGLTSYALKSPCGSFCIPINEGTDKKSQINEYLEEYKGPGVQHLAFLTHDILKSLKGLKDTSIETLNMDDEYYQEVFDRVPNVTEDKKEIKDLQVLVDGDDQGYLLQIFTKNLIGPIFIEIIQRKNHFSFGEGNFGALFRSIEKDQEQRGYI
ncbi:MAG: 4-hydroxyphenylpyruvate dioxygenase [Epsilonproteobacteria bacterium]|nr:MAG: 4-hydroxyphenylpyruvate dioxygenase [Campylobacterota bacterium]RLA67675.1 MAG: 4-hydroxyphenylpyruvate dioxygenase [Campylobacterota bacterium]